MTSSTQSLSLVPGLLGQFVRRAFLWLVLEECATSVTVEFGTTFSKVDARLGENVYIGLYCSLGSVVLERDALAGTVGSHSERTGHARHREPGHPDS